MNFHMRALNTTCPPQKVLVVVPCENECFENLQEF